MGKPLNNRHPLFLELLKKLVHFSMRNAFFTFLFLCSSLVFAQSVELANSYYRKGEYNKAILLFEPLYDENPVRQDYFKALLTCYQQVEDFEKGQQLIENQMALFPAQVQLWVELGYHQQLQGNIDQANSNYDRAISLIANNPGYGFAVGRSFRQNHLLDYALEAYRRTKELNPALITELQEAQIYGEKGDFDKMFDLYLDLLAQHDNYLSVIQRYTGKFISDDPKSPNNILFKKKVLKRVQEDPALIWSQLLSWQFIQEKDYAKALIHEKSLFKRNPVPAQRLFNLGEIAYHENDLSTAKATFAFIKTIDDPVLVPDDIRFDSNLYLVEIEAKTASNKEENDLVSKSFESLIQEYGFDSHTLELHLAYARFLTKKSGDPDKALKHLNSIPEEGKTAIDLAMIAMEIGDILVFTDQFNQALITYSRIEYDVKNSIIAQEARFKVARTSYFKGDFDWALHQLKVLKSSTSQLIANDALELSLTIGNNREADSLDQALQAYATADLLAYQQKYSMAIDSLSSLLVDFRGRAIEDDALFKRAEIYSLTGDYLKAEADYLSILNEHPNSLLLDDTLFNLANLYRDQLSKPNDAQRMYERLLFEYPSSIHLVEARKAFRKLRGDNLP